MVGQPYSNFTQNNGGRFITVGPTHTFLLLSDVTIKLST